MKSMLEGDLDRRRLAPQSYLAACHNRIPDRSSLHSSLQQFSGIRNHHPIASRVNGILTLSGMPPEPLLIEICTESVETLDTFMLTLTSTLLFPFCFLQTTA